MPCAQVARSSKINSTGCIGSGPTSRAAALRPGQTNRGGCREQQCFRRIRVQRIGFEARLETLAERRRRELLAAERVARDRAALSGCLRLKRPEESPSSSVLWNQAKSQVWCRGLSHCTRTPFGEWSAWLINERNCLTSCRVVCCRAGSTQEARGLASSCFCAAASSALASVRAPKESLGGATTSACGNSAWCCG